MLFLVMTSPPPNPALLGFFGLGLIVLGAIILSVFQKSVTQLMARNWSMSSFGATPNPSLMRFFALLAGCIVVLFGLLLLASAFFPAPK
jgi:hypothetical protein